MRRAVPVVLLTALSLALGGTAASAHEDGAAGAQASGAPMGPEPPLLPTPKADCGLGSRTETGLQGRVSPEDHESGSAAKGFACNTRLVGSYAKPNALGTVGGFKVERYVDSSGHECAYYDTTLMYPTNVLDQEGGVNVLDMSNPAKPVLTDRLVTPAMLTPHESLVLSQQRGVLAAVAGNLTTNVGIVDLYDISGDCRHPVLKSTSPVGVLGHESGMTPDGKTFYSASPAGETLVAVDISNLSLPVPIWSGSYDSHGLSLSNDGNRAYIAGTGSGLIILDTTEVQARVPDPNVPEVARLQWNSMSIPQNAIPVTIKGHPYLVEIDEFGAGNEVGAGRIIDIADETTPRVVSNLRLEVHQPEHFETLAGDNGQDNPVQGYAGHYCNVPRREDPGIVACSMILSGLRVFDIRDPENPREIAYYNAPVTPRIVPPGGHRPGAKQLGDVEPLVCPQPRRDLVLRRAQRLPRRPRHQRRLAVRRRGRAPVPRPALADRPAQRRPGAAGLRPGPAPPRAGYADPQDTALVPLLRQAQLGPRQGRLLSPRPRGAGRHDRPRARQPRRAAGCLRPRPAARLLPPSRHRTGALPLVSRQPAPDRRAPGAGALRGRRHAEAAAEQGRAPAPPAAGRALDACRTATTTSSPAPAPPAASSPTN